MLFLIKVHLISSSLSDHFIDLNFNRICRFQTKRNKKTKVGGEREKKSRPSKQTNPESNYFSGFLKIVRSDLFRFRSSFDSITFDSNEILKQKVWNGPEKWSTLNVFLIRNWLTSIDNKKNRLCSGSAKMHPWEPSITYSLFMGFKLAFWGTYGSKQN